jgi:hypothetical protein
MAHAKIATAVSNKRNRNDRLRLIEPPDDGCEQSRVAAFKATDGAAAGDSTST